MSLLYDYNFFMDTTTSMDLLRKNWSQKIIQQRLHDGIRKFKFTDQNPTKPFEHGAAFRWERTKTFLSKMDHFWLTENFVQFFVTLLPKTAQILEIRCKMPLILLNLRSFKNMAYNASESATSSHAWNILPRSCSLCWSYVCLPSMHGIIIAKIKM